MPSAACDRCRTFATLAAVGPLQLCQACTPVGLAPACAEFAHDYRGGVHGWVCLRCGGTVTLETSAAPMPAAKSPWDD